MAKGTEAVVPGGMARAGLSVVIDPPGIGPPILRPVLDYWEQKRGGRAMPTRHDIEPSELRAHLPHLCLIEPLPGNEFRYRLVGSAITERYGRNSTGKTVRECYADQPATGECLTQILLTVTKHRRPVLASATLAAIGKEHIFSEALMLPLSDDGARVTMILSATRYSPASGGAAPSAGA